MKIRRTYLSIIPRIFLSSHNHIRTFSVYSVRNIKEKCAKFHNKNPLVSNCFIYGGITGFTELTQQTVQLKLVPYWTDKELSNYDLVSLARYTCLGLVVFAPVLHYWYRFLDRKYPTNTKIVVMKKVALDLIVLGIPLYAFFYAFMCGLEGNSFQQILKELEKKLLATLLAGAAFWVPAQTINFRFIQPSARILFISLCTFIEVNILSVLKKMDFDD